MTDQPLTTDERLSRIDVQLERIAQAIVKGFDRTDTHIQSVETQLRTQIDIYARALAGHALWFTPTG